jgi:hypothetical protein
MTFRYQLTRITRNSLISKGFHKAIVGSFGTYDACGHKHGCQQNQQMSTDHFMLVSTVLVTVPGPRPSLGQR